MSFLGKYWKLVLSAVLLAAGLAVFFFLYTPEKRAYDEAAASLNEQVILLTAQLKAVEPDPNTDYSAVAALLPEAEEALDKSRNELYDSFPLEMKEEDQILYILDLEKHFGNTIDFDFGDAEYITTFADGANLMGLTLTVNYKTTYQGFKDMVNFLSTDENITSVRYAEMSYDAQSDTLTGTVTIERYLIDRPDRAYEEPDIAEPATGKENIFN